MESGVAAAKYLVIPEAGVEDLRALFALEPGQIETIDRVLASKETATGSVRAYQLLAKELQIGHSTALDVLNAVRNLRMQMDRFGLNEEELINDVVRILGEESSPGEETRAALVNVFRKGDDDYFVDKLSSLKRVLVPHLDKVTTIVDSRPVFSRTRESIDGMLLVAFLQLETHDPDTEEYSVSRVQLSRQDIDKVIERLQDAKLKLDKLADTLKDFDLYE